MHFVDYKPFLDMGKYCVANSKVITLYQSDIGHFCINVKHYLVNTKFDSLSTDAFMILKTDKHIF